MIDTEYPRTQNYYENNCLRMFFVFSLVFPYFLSAFVLSKCPGKKDIFKELRVRFVFFLKIAISKLFFGSNNFVSEGMTGRRFHRTTEVIPRQPWKSKKPPLLPDLFK